MKDPFRDTLSQLIREDEDTANGIITGYVWLACVQNPDTMEIETVYPYGALEGQDGHASIGLARILSRMLESKLVYGEFDE